MKEDMYWWDMTIQAPIVEQATESVHSGKALDLGSGEGCNALYLAKKGFDVLAVDVDKNALNILEKKANAKGLHAVRTEINNVLDFNTGADYDYIVCNMVLHFLKSQVEVQHVITTMKAATSSGGVNVIGAYTDRNEPGKRPYLFKTNELKEYYHNWKIIYYEEKPALWFQMPNEDKP